MSPEPPPPTPPPAQPPPLPQPPPQFPQPLPPAQQQRPPPQQPWPPQQVPPPQWTQPKPAAPQKKGGCLRGCLITLLVLVVLTVAGFFAARSYIYANLEELKDRYPIAGAIIDLFGIGPDPDEGGADPRGRQAGGDDPALLPDDIPVHPDAAAESYSISGQLVTVYQLVHERPGAVTDHFARAMPDAGWDAAGEEDVGYAIRHRWEKRERYCAIEIGPFEGSTDVWLRCGEAGVNPMPGASASPR